LALDVDNTPPQLNVSKPIAAFVSANIDVDATALDSNGILSMTATGLPGFVDQDASPARVFGTWPVPAAQPMGLSRSPSPAATAFTTARARPSR